MDEKYEPYSPQLIDVDALAYDVRWLIRLRWVAVALVFATLILGQRVNWMGQLAQPLFVTAMLGILNAWWHMRASGEGRQVLQKGARYWRRRVLVQLHTDLLALTLILHWTGGIENPFSSFYVFPVAIATMLLPLGQAFLVFGSSYTLFLGLIVLHLVTDNPHRPLVPFDPTAGAVPDTALALHPLFLTGVAVARFITLLGTVLFLSMLLNRLRQTEAKRRRQEQVALSHERLARVGMIAAGLTHSIRNPLHGTLNCISLLRDATSEEERAITIGLLEEGLLRIETVTRRVMDMTREAPFSPEPTQLQEWLTTFLQPFHVRNYVGKQVEITTDLQAVPDVVIDRDRVYECLSSLISNAIDALPDTGGIIHISMKPIERPFPGVEITVEDNGQGISPEHLARVFDPFFTTKPIGEGTGLGLAIARRGIERHGGEISLAARPQGGTCATVRLPYTPFEGT